MDLICVVCGHEPQEGETYIKLEKWLQGKGGSGKTENSVMICSQHIGQDITNAFRNGGYAYRKHIEAEKEG